MYLRGRSLLINNYYLQITRLNYSRLSVSYLCKFGFTSKFAAMIIRAFTVFRTFVIILFLICCASWQDGIEKTRLNLNTEWKFIQGDKPEYALPEYDDSGWKLIKTDKIWENYGYDPYDGYAWYRLKIRIPSSLKEKAFLKDSLRIYLGKINNFDQTFLNGKIIGINGVNLPANTKIDTTFINNPVNFYDKKRPYTLSINDPRIIWDKENVIAVRVYDQGGQGGMYTGDQFIAMTKLSDYLLIEKNKDPYLLQYGELGKKVSIKNISVKYILKGKLKIAATNKLTGSTLFQNEKDIVLNPGDNPDFSINLRPLDQSALVSFEFAIDKSDDKVCVVDETPYLTTPPSPKRPVINGPSITAARPGRPFLYTIPATGEKPMDFDVIGLPKGLELDKSTGIISGKLNIKGEYNVILVARNMLGEDKKEFTISIGDRICLTPPMGWNSWNCWGVAVDEQKVLASAMMYRDKGLLKHGWTYINIDDGWEIPKDQEPKRDKDGYILTNAKFPDMKRLGDSIHAMGMKFGIYSSPGPLTCGDHTGSYGYEGNDARSYTKWGIDYLKYDWCSYNEKAKDTTRYERMKPYFLMRNELDKVDRDIVYSLCQYGMSKVWEWGDKVGGNLWRTTGDITDTWESLKEIGFSQTENAAFAKPGNWNDPDMLIVGWVGWGPNLHPTRLTPDEQYTHISLWCLLSAPLLIGCDLERLDEFTLNLLTNDEVLAIDQDPLGYQARQKIVDGDIQVWVKELADGSKAAGIFNLGNKTENYKLILEKTGLKPGSEVRDLWRQKPMGKVTDNLILDIPSHGVILLKFS